MYKPYNLARGGERLSLLVYIGHGEFTGILGAVQEILRLCLVLVAVGSWNHSTVHKKI